ncbi:putative 60S ribosomal protein [Trypoxylus dichotomus]
MVSHNNMIYNGHFHKKWQRFVKLWFDQPFQKAKRNRKRVQKANKRCPRPIDLLRPIVRCPTVRYHIKHRLGHGFSHQELKAAGINKRYAQTIGIAVDHRRRNKSYESLKQNVVRLQDYTSRLILYPKGTKKAQPEKTVSKNLNVLKDTISAPKARVPTEEEKQFQAFITLRKVRTEKKTLSRRVRKKNKEAKSELARN